MAVVFATFFVLFGVTTYRPWGAIGQAATYWFQPVPGQVAKVVRDNDGVFIEIEYSYEHQGQRYFNNQLSRLPDDVKWEFDPFENKQVGDPITVYLRPESPQESVLLQGFSHTAYFFFVWIGGATLGWFYFFYEIFYFGAAKTSFREALQRRVEDNGTVLRICMVPGNSSPMTAGLLLFLIVGAIAFSLAMAGDHWAHWWQISLPLAATLSVILATAAGLYEYHDMIEGNRRGRWDLIVDRKAGILQTPAGDFGQHCTVKFADIRGFSCQLSFPPDEDYPNPPIALQLHYVEHGTDNVAEISLSRNQTELDALADWIREAVGLDESEQLVEA